MERTFLGATARLVVEAPSGRRLTLFLADGGGFRSRGNRRNEILCACAPADIVLLDSDAWRRHCRASARQRVVKGRARP